MLELRGAPALSTFRSEKLLETIKKDMPAIQSVYAEFMHFIDISEDLTGWVKYSSCSSSVNI